MIVYRGIFMDLEADPVTNVVEQVEKRVDIIKDENPYNVVITSETVGFDVEYTFTFDTLPAGAFQTQIMWSNDGGLSWSTSTGGISSPQTITLPASVYVFQFVVYFPDNITVTYSQVETILPLEMADDPLCDIVIDNDEDKFTPIRARQMEIKVHTSSSININTFAVGSDTTYKVNIYRDDVLTFTGFLSTGDLQQEFMPDPNILILVAVDGLGFLNDIPLTNFDGDNPENEHPILHYLLWALSKTGLRLNLATIFNIREVSASALLSDNDGLGHFFRFIYLDAKTFEDEVGTSINCYDVIARILGNEAFLCQYMGEWWIVRVDEMEAEVDQIVYAWDWEGTLVRNGIENHTASVGVGEEYSWMNDDAIIGIEQLKKESRLTYRFVKPREVPCNIDLERGDPIDESGEEQRFTIDCWTLRTSVPPFIANNNTAYIVKLFDANGYPTDVYAEITFDEWVGGNASFLESSGIPVQVNGKIQWGYDFRFDQDYTTGSGTINVNMCSIRLDADDGTVYFLDEDGEWYLSDSTWSVNYKVFVNSWDVDDVDENEWRAFTNPVDESKPLPKSGRLYIMIHWENTEELEGIYLNIQNISFNYLAYINGSYKDYTAQRHTVAQETTNRNIRDEEVYISDSPERIFKGALLIEGDTDYELAGLFYSALHEQSGNGDPSFLKRFGEMRAFDVWNQVNRTMVKFDGTIDHTNPHPSLITKYTLTDVHDNTAGRIFILLHYEADMHLCEWTAFIVETSNANISKRYTGNTFKYLTNE